MTHHDSTLRMPLQLSSRKLSIFNRLSAAPVSNSAKRRRSRKKKFLSDTEYPEITSNMVGLSKSKGKQPVICSGESDDELSSNLKEILSES